jgi:hypothetical protein
MQRNSEQQYLAGLWRDSLVLDMCWYRNDHGKTNQSPLAGSRAPSWSWASVDGPITYNSHLLDITRLIPQSFASPRFWLSDVRCTALRSPAKSTMGL